MIGRASDPSKNFQMGYRAFAEIIIEVPDVKLEIIIKLVELDYLKNLVNSLNIKNYIKYTGYLPDPEE